MGRKTEIYSERLSVGFTVDQMRQIEDLERIRARKGEVISKADIVRDAVIFYMAHQDDVPGTRAQITRKLEDRFSKLETAIHTLVEITQQNLTSNSVGSETRLSAIETAVQGQNTLLKKMIAFLDGLRTQKSG